MPCAGAADLSAAPHIGAKDYGAIDDWLLASRTRQGRRRPHGRFVLRDRQIRGGTITLIRAAPFPPFWPTSWARAPTARLPPRSPRRPPSRPPAPAACSRKSG